MPGRILPLVNNELYHVFNRGSDRRNIFLQSRDYERFTKTFFYYQFIGPKPRLSFLNKNNFIRFKPTQNSKLVEILSYCLMPNHVHFLLKQLKTNGISIFMSQVSNSYTRHFNTKYKRIGPLLQGSFKTKLVQTDEQLVHVSRYIHINPVVDGLVSKPQNYQWSSYTEYSNGKNGYCSTDLIMGLFASGLGYRKFTEAQIDYGKSLAIIKHQLLEDE